MINNTKILTFLLTIILLASCSAITDFTLSENKINIKTELPDTLKITLNGNTGTLNLNFANELPVENADAIYDLIGYKILIQVTNNENNVGVLLTDKPVDKTPDKAGEYMVTIDSNNKNINITFYNMYEGHALSAEGDFKALLHIDPNDYFEAGNYDFKVIVK